MKHQTLFGLGTITPKDITTLARKVETPFYLYDESLIIGKCDEVREMENAFGLRPRFAMKANSNAEILRLINSRWFGIDASSLNEARRAVLAGIKPEEIMLTSQEVPRRDDRFELFDLMAQGLQYNVCSQRQLDVVASFAKDRGIPLSIRVHPGTGGTGESVTRNTANPYSCFGVHISQLDNFLRNAKRKGVVFNKVHNHIGSGGSPEKWKEGVDRLLGIVESRLQYLPNLEAVSFGGGLKEARMPDEARADLKFLGGYSAKRVKEFAERTGKQLLVEVEPGTYVIAMSGNAVMKVLDKKTTERGINFVILDGGMELNSRPLLYGSRHPFAVVSRNGKLLSSDYNFCKTPRNSLWIPVGRCCESGDSQALDEEGNVVPRRMAEPEVGDYFVVGGAGAYCSSMAPFNYNSHTQAPEVIKRIRGVFDLIRRPQTLKQIIQNETNQRI
jgi:diaminopimelate decarboxylase